MIMIIIIIIIIIIIYNEKSCLISMPFLSTYIDVRTVDFFPPAESWLVNLNFPRASRMQGRWSYR